MQWDDSENIDSGGGGGDTTTPPSADTGTGFGPPPWWKPGMPLGLVGGDARRRTDPDGNTWVVDTATGQWTQEGAATPPSTPPSTPPPSYSAPSGGGGNIQTAMETFPQFTAPGFTPQQGLTAPNPYSFTPFSYQDFRAPSLEDAKNQPGYLFGLKQGQDALQNSAAARGTLRSGGTLKDLFGYTNAAAEQNYGNVFNQDLTQYNTNRDNAFGTWAANTGAGASAWNMNYGAAKDVNSTGNAANQTNYQNAFQNAAAEFNPLFNASQLTFSDSYNRWLAKLNSLTNIATAGAV